MLCIIIGGIKNNLHIYYEFSVNDIKLTIIKVIKMLTDKWLFNGWNTILHLKVQIVSHFICRLTRYGLGIYSQFVANKKVAVKSQYV